MLASLIGIAREYNLIFLTNLTSDRAKNRLSFVAHVASFHAIGFCFLLMHLTCFQIQAKPRPNSTPGTGTNPQSTQEWRATAPHSGPRKPPHNTIAAEKTCAPDPVNLFGKNYKRETITEISGARNGPEFGIPP